MKSNNPELDKDDCSHCLPKEHCIWCSDKYPDKDKLTIDLCKKCGTMTNHYDGECLRCKVLKSG